MSNKILFFSLFCLISGFLSAQTQIADADGDTNVKTEAVPNENIVRISTNGASRLNILGNINGITRMDVFNSNQGLFLGFSAGKDVTATGTNNTALGFRAGEKTSSGFDNTFVGQSAGTNTTSGNSNVAVGSGALLFNTTGASNIAIGVSALNQSTTAFNNTAVGTFSLSQNTASDNTALGSSALQNNTSGGANTALGRRAGQLNTTGSFNLAAGNEALRDNTTGSNNTALGYFALSKNTTAANNTAVGYHSLLGNTTGTLNTALGSAALFTNSTGNNNVALGGNSLNQLSSGSNNVAVGTSALQFNATGTSNVAVGHEALRNTTGSNNTALGFQALTTNTLGGFNTAVGHRALNGSTSGGNQSAFGNNALFACTTGAGNTALGDGALSSLNTGSSNTAVGRNSGSLVGPAVANCTYVGFDAGNNAASNFNNSTALGNGSRITASNQVRIGNSSVTSIGGFANWTNVSDGRVKKNVKENVPGLDFIRQLRPVTYHLDMEEINDRMNGDPSAENRASIEEKNLETQTGFIAQEVENAARNLGYSFSGVDAPKNETDLYGLRYAEFVVPMVKAMQEQQAQIEAQARQIEQLTALVGRLSQNSAVPATDLQIWPNPAGETLQVNVAGAAEGARINLYGADGKLIQSRPAAGGLQILELRGVPAGIFYVELQSPGSPSVNRQAVKVAPGN